MQMIVLLFIDLGSSYSTHSKPRWLKCPAGPYFKNGQNRMISITNATSAPTITVKLNHPAVVSIMINSFFKDYTALRPPF